MWIYIIGPLIGGTLAGFFQHLNTKAIEKAKSVTMED